MYYKNSILAEMAMDWGKQEICWMKKIKFSVGFYKPPKIILFQEG